MARPILPTPTLVGKEAENFWLQIAPYKDYLKEKGIVLDRKKIKEEAEKFRALFKKNNNENKQFRRNIRSVTYKKPHHQTF